MDALGELKRFRAIKQTLASIRRTSTPGRKPLSAGDRFRLKAVINTIESGHSENEAVTDHGVTLQFFEQGTGRFQA